MSARQFIADLFDITEWPFGGDVDLFTVQDLAVKHGILKAVTKYEPCGESCQCAEYHGTDEMKEGVTCFRKPKWMLRRKS